MTRFKPSMVEILPDGSLVKPPVWDLHLHHVVWLSPGLGPGVRGGRGEDARQDPQGYGLQVGGDDTWGLDYMIHALTAKGDRSVYITWEIDWVPADAPRGDINPLRVQWMDVAGFPQIYPVFDAERASTATATGSTCSRTRSRPTRRRLGTRSARRSARVTAGPCRGTSTSSAATATCIPAACTSTSGSRATGPTRARSTATTRPRSGRCSVPTPATTSRQAP